MGTAAASSLKLRLVGAISITNFGGRLIAGIASDALAVKRGWFLVAASAGMALTYAITALCSVWTAAGLIGVCAGIGLCYGALWSILPVLVSELFGAETFGLAWGWLVLSPAGGAALFNIWTGFIYESEASRQAAAGAENGPFRRVPSSPRQRPPMTGKRSSHIF